MKTFLELLRAYNDQHGYTCVGTVEFVIYLDKYFTSLPISDDANSDIGK